MLRASLFCSVRVRQCRVACLCWRVGPSHPSNCPSRPPLVLPLLPPPPRTACRNSWRRWGGRQARAWGATGRAWPRRSSCRHAGRHAALLLPVQSAFRLLLWEGGKCAVPACLPACLPACQCLIAVPCMPPQRPSRAQPALRPAQAFLCMPPRSGLPPACPAAEDGRANGRDCERGAAPRDGAAALQAPALGQLQPAAHAGSAAHKHGEKGRGGEGEGPGGGGGGGAGKKQTAHRHGGLPWPRLPLLTNMVGGGDPPPPPPRPPPPRQLLLLPPSQPVMLASSPLPPSPLAFTPPLHPTAP